MSRTQKGADLDTYPWDDAEETCAHEYLLPMLPDILDGLPGLASAGGGGTRVLDLGCGNGTVTAWLAERSFDAVGVDPSVQGIEQARAAHPDLEFHQASAYDPLREEFGMFPLVVSLEVIEHVYDPPGFARSAFDVLSPGGVLVLSTPYHGYLKNVAIAVLDRFDDHVNPLRVHGHIKFWSPRTLARLLEETGFAVEEFRYSGRIPPLAKSMIAVARRPETSRAPQLQEGG